MFDVEVLTHPGDLCALRGVAAAFGEAGGAGGPDPVPEERNILLWLLDVTLDIAAPVAWWRQASAYDINIFAFRRRSGEEERLLVPEDFEGPVPAETLAVLNNYIRDGQPETAARLLPVNFIRRALVKANYRVLRDIHAGQRDNADEHWQALIAFIATLPHGRLITAD